MGRARLGRWFVGLISLVSTACAHGSSTSAVEASVADEASETSATGTAAPPADDAEGGVDVEYIAAGHAFVARLLCPSGVPPRRGAVGTGKDDLGRLTDSYQLTCATGSMWVLFPHDAAPEVPDGWTLIDEVSFDILRKVGGRDPDWTETEAATTELLERYPNWVAARRLRAVARLRTLRPEEGWADLGVIKDVNDDLRLEWGFIGTRLGHCAEVSADLEALAAARDESWERYGTLTCLRSVCTLEAGRKDEADALADRACELGVLQCCPSEPTDAPDGDASR